MISGLPRRVTSLLVWGGVTGLFSLSIVTGNLILSALILSSVLLVNAMLVGPHLFVYLWLIGQPTFFVFINQVLKNLPFVTMERIMLLVLLGMMIMRVVFVKIKHPRLTHLEYLMIAYLSYALISLTMTTSSIKIRLDLWFFMQYAIPMLMFIISSRIDWSERNIRMLLASFTLMGILLAVMGILQVFFGVGMFTADYQTVTGGHMSRAHGAFTNAHTYSATLLIFFILTLLQYGLYRDSLVRFALIAAMLFMTVGIILGQTRGPWLGFVLALFIVYLNDRNIRTVMAIGGMTALIAGIIVLISMTGLGFLEDRVSNVGTIAGRITTWATAVNMIAHHPVFGVGFGSEAFILHKNEYLSGIGSLSAQNAVHLGVPHNEYIHVAVQLGITGLLMFLGILYSLVRLMLRVHKDVENHSINRQLGAYTGAILIGLLFNSMFSDTFLQDYFWMLAFFLAGLAVGKPQDLDSRQRHLAYGGGQL